MLLPYIAMNVLNGLLNADALDTPEILGFLVLILMVPVVIWLQFRLSLCCFALARMPDCGAITALKTGFSATKQHIGRIFSMSVATGWPYLVVSIFFVIIGYDESWVALATLGLGQLLYGAYIILSLAGLSEVLLTKVPNLKDTPVQE